MSKNGFDVVARKSGNSLVVTIPYNVVKAHGIKNGTVLRVKIWVPESIKVEKTMFEGWSHVFVVIKGRFDVAEIILSEGQASELINKIQEVLETI